MLIRSAIAQPYCSNHRRMHAAADSKGPAVNDKTMP